MIIIAKAISIVLKTPYCAKKRLSLYTDIKLITKSGKIYMGTNGLNKRC